MRPPLSDSRAPGKRTLTLPLRNFGGSWRDLFARDVAERYRHEWERLTINHLPRLTVKDLRSFQAKFEVAMGRVGDCTEIEIAKRFLQALPSKQQEKILQEQSKRAQKQHWVNLHKPNPFTLQEVLDFVARLLEKPARVEENSVGFLIDCRNLKGQEMLLACDGLEVNGMRLQFVVTRRKLSYPEMFQWLLERLQTREEIEASILQTQNLWQNLDAIESKKVEEKAPKTLTTSDKPGKPSSRPNTPPKTGPSTPVRGRSPSGGWRDSSKGGWYGKGNKSGGKGEFYRQDQGKSNAKGGKGPRERSTGPWNRSARGRWYDEDFDWIRKC